MDKETAPKDIDTWAVVELFGHQKIAGHLTTQVLGVSALFRVDVPAYEFKRREFDYDKRSYFETLTKVAPFTRYLGVGAIYAINPCSEEFARQMLPNMAQPPADALQIQRLALPPAEDPPKCKGCGSDLTSTELQEGACDDCGTEIDKEPESLPEAES